MEELIGETAMAAWEDGGEFYGFVEAAPPRSGARDNVVFDAVEIQGFDHGHGEEDGTPCIIRVMSTRDRLRTLFRIEEFAEGQWYRLKLQHHPGMPIAWILPAANDFGGPVSRTNLVWLQRLTDGIDPGGAPSNGDRLAAWCQAASKKAERELTDRALWIPSGASGAASPPRMHVRVVDVGHASCAVLHERRDPDSSILGYYDVGRPIFFHAASAPGGFAATEGGRVPTSGFVVLSHWDFDHYSMAVSNGLKGLQQLNWFAPDQAVGPNAAKLQRNLAARLHLIGMSHLSIGRGLSLHRGTGSPADRNGSGYAVRLDQAKDTVLLPGDIGYSLIAPSATAKLTGFVATHHGGSGGSAPPSGSGQAIVSFGSPNRYGHPAPAEIAALRAAGWSVVYTAYHEGVARGDRWLTAP